MSDFSTKEQWEWFDVRVEIADFEREHRRWPKSGSVSKPFSSSECDPFTWYFRRWSTEDRERAMKEREQEQFYRYHSPVFKGWLLNFGDQGTNL